MSKYKFKNQQLVTFDAMGFIGKGFVIGYSVSEQPIIGASVIIQVTESNIQLPTEEYPFNVVSLFEAFVEPVDLGE